ncbi:TonB-dependent receptor domain-containing protein [Galbibacter sp. BG1]
MKSLKFIFLLFCSVSSFAQQYYTLSGTINDQGGNKITSGSVFLQQKNNTKLYSIIENGTFHFNSIPSATYIVSVELLGYENYQKELSINDDTNIEITLKESTTNLDEVVLTGHKKTITQKNGTVKAIIEGTPLSTLPEAVDVLAKLPKIQLSADKESISVVGKGTPLIYVGNRRISLTELNAIPVDAIKSVELLQNPSVKYEAEGQSVILITTKNSGEDGIKSSVSEISSFKRRFNNYLSINSAYKKGKFELQGNFGYNQLKHWESNSSTFNVDDKTSSYLAVSTGPRLQIPLGLGAFYQWSEDTYIAINTNYQVFRDFAPIHTVSSIQENDEKTMSRTSNDSQENRDFITSNLSLNKGLKHINGNLFIGIQYSKRKKDLESNIFNATDNSTPEFYQYRDQQTAIEVFNSRIDFEKKLFDSLTWQLGGNITKGTTNAFSHFKLKDSASETTDYIYKEDNYASYSQIAGSFDRLEFSAGLRMESNLIKAGYKEAENFNINREQLRFFPKTTVSYAISEKDKLIFNYAKTIHRPLYSQTNAISVFLNPFLEFSNNINLQASIKDEVSIRFEKSNKSIALIYSSEKNPVYYSIFQNENNSQLIMSPTNFNKEINYQIELTYPMQYKFWESMNTILVALTKVTDTTADIQKPTPYLYYYSNHTFNLPNSFTLGCNFWGVTSRNEGVFNRNALFSLGIFASKAIKQHLTFTINFNDIFKGLTYEELYNINNIDSKTFYYADAHEVSISLKYSFGALKKAAFKNRTVDENINRIN